MSDWQPIETIPKDGTKVLVGRFEHGCKLNGRQVVDHWEVRPKKGYTGLGKFNIMYWPSTHWMPLPPPPSGSDIGESDE